MFLPVIAALVVCALLAAPAKSNEQDSEIYRFDQFMNTDEDIWVLNTTQSAPKNCKKDKKHNITESRIVFLRSHQDGNKIVNATLLGDFYQDIEKKIFYDTIHISGDESGVYAEQLYYSSKDSVCGLVQVFAGSGNNGKYDLWRELRVRGRPNYHNLDEECKSQYKAYVEAIEKTSTSPYRANCQ
uniref:Lipocalin n=1 Tax=Rhipicephalus appendiculatus TaxID=34631 RepID=A0A131YSA4_RHIAP